MKCVECTTQALEEFLDGELDARRAADTGVHLAACRACALRYDELLDEHAMYTSYERALDVTPQALWGGVAARIGGEPRPSRERQPARTSLLPRMRAWLAPALVSPRFSPALTAALVLLAIGATATVMRYANPQTAAPRDLAGVTQPSLAAAATPSPGIVRQQTQDAAPAVASSGSDSSSEANKSEGEGRKTRKPEPARARDAERKPRAASNDPAQILADGQNNEFARRQRATERLVREAESKYLAAIRMLSEDVDRKRTRLDPQVAARFDETLATIDRSIAETRRTVFQQRNDPIAVQYMLSAYAKKVEVMREMATLD